MTSMKTIKKHLKKGVCIVCTCTLTTGIFAPLGIASIEAASKWKGYTKISSEKQLKSTFSGKSKVKGKYYLSKNITVSGKWTSCSSFSGTLDGNGKTITIKKTSTGNNSLIKKNSGTIKNITVQSSNISTTPSGYSVATGILTTSNNGTISNCSTKGKLSVVAKGSTTKDTTINVGGITAINNGAITKCINKADIIAKGTYKKASSLGVYAGGISGTNHKNIRQCGNASGAEIIFGSNSENYDYTIAGGISGINGGNISECYNKGEISNVKAEDTYKYQQQFYIGGIAGNNLGTIGNCYNRYVKKINYPSNISIQSKNVYSSASGYMAGITGLNSEKSSIHHCYSTSSLYGDLDATYLSNYFINMIAGYNSGGSIKTSNGLKVNTQSLPASTFPICTGSYDTKTCKILSETAMKKKENWSAFSKTTWNIKQGSYPSLKWE